MKSVACLVAFTAALAATPALGEVCNADAITQKLLPIVAPAQACQDESKFSFIPPADYPTPSEIAAICTASKCKALIEKAETLEFPTCEIPLASGPMGIDKLFTSVAAKCKSGDYSKGAAGSGSGSLGAGAGDKIEQPPSGGLRVTPAPQDSAVSPKGTATPAPTKSAATSTVVATAVLGATGLAMFSLL
ncbi:hypothetical protein P43SY_005660 [Pythium insidiosum]|uniref:Elicitin n=1 Tax=Pythium insidiosum TaxID=114742 RepID=A0AAD5LCL5_PYTIN|nr:hypothetical protein P43SY_005660 [Pythium insidiosum]